MRERDSEDNRENDRMGKCHTCGDQAKIIVIDIHGDWPAKFIPVTACCESDFDD